jgi:hypothetical protein
MLLLFSEVHDDVTDTCVVHPGNTPSPHISESCCHHHAFDADELQKYKERANEIVASLETELGDFTTDDHHFSWHDPTCADDGSTAPHSVNFEPQTVGESMELCNKIEDNLTAGNLETVGDLEELREMLIEQLETEYHLKELQWSIKFCGPHADAFVESEKT